MIWSESFAENNWHLSASNNTSARVRFQQSLSLEGSFSKTNESKSASLSRALSISLDRHPVVVSKIYVSQGIHYGIRFSGTTSTGQKFQSWREDSSLQHRPGLGLFENITADVAKETFLANGHAPEMGSIITNLWFYVEATPDVVGAYSMNVGSIQAYPLESITNGSGKVSGSLQGVVANVRMPHLGNTLFQVFATFQITGTSDLHYTPFLLSNGSIVAQGFAYVPKQISDQEVIVLLPQLVSGSPSFIPDFSTTAIIVLAQRGQINYFNLEDLSFKFISTPPQTSSSLAPGTIEVWMPYYFAFLFGAPIAVVILVLKVFRHEN